MADALSLTPSAAPAPARPAAGPAGGLRPKQWTKNLLLFAGLLFTLDARTRRATSSAASGFVLFCALSSVVYLVNDVADRESDRLHPKKRRRPIAAGRDSPGRPRRRRRPGRLRLDLSFLLDLALRPGRPDLLRC